MRLLLLLLFVLTACTPKPATTAAADSATAPAGVIDSILPIPLLLDRFRAGLTESQAFGGGFTTDRDTLVTRFVRALEAADTVALDAMVLDRAEYAWLYYPAHIYARPPYELAPATFWQLIQGNSTKGRARLTQTLAGTAFVYRGMTCTASTNVQPPLTEVNCRLKLVVGGAPTEGTYFGSIAERDGRFKFVSFANDF